MEVRSNVQRSLNPEAPEFFPARNAFVPQYQTLPSPNPLSFSASQFCYSSYYTYGHQNAVQYPFHLTTDKTAFAPVSEPPVSSLLGEAAQEHKPNVMMGPSPKHNVRDSRRRNRRSSSYVKEGFIRADYSQSCKKQWRVKPTCGNEDRHVVRTAEASSEFPWKAQDFVTNNKNREKHPPIPLKCDGNETTVMIRNIPNRYTRDMLKDILDQHCKLKNQEAQDQKAGAGEKEAPLSAFDFLYLPIDFVTKSNKGYAFVNFTNPGAVRKLFDAWDGKHWDRFHSNKIREICCAKLQGLEQLIRNFERMQFPSEDFQPVRFNPARDGPEQRVEETKVGRCTDRL